MSDVQPEDGPISVDQAVGLLGAEPEPAPEPEPESAAEPPAAAEPEPEPEPTGEPADEDAADEPPIPAPQSWDAAAKALFETLPRDAQSVIQARETDRDKAVQRSVQEAVDARKLAAERSAEAQRVTEIKAAFDQVLPTATQVFQSKWANWTPAAQAELARTDPAGFIALDTQFKAEAAAMSELQRVNRQAQDAAFAQFVRDESVKLAELVPVFADPKEGVARKQALSRYLVEQNVPADQIPLLDANTIRLAHKAMLWDESQAKAATAARTTPSRAPAPASPAVRPAAAQATPTRQRTIESARERLSQTGSTEDAIALLRAQRASRG